MQLRMPKEKVALAFPMCPNHLLCWTVTLVKLALERKTLPWGLHLETVQALPSPVTENQKARRSFHSLKSHQFLRPGYILVMNLHQKCLSFLVSSAAVRVTNVALWFLYVTMQVVQLVKTQHCICWCTIPPVIVRSGCCCSGTKSVTPLICSGRNRTEPDTGYSHLLALQ